MLIVNGTESHGKNEFDELKNIDQNYYCSNYYDVSVNKYGVKCRTSLRFWENKGGLILLILLAGVSGISDIGLVENL